MPVKQTPLVAQYLSVKQKVPDAILLFRLGDFYEMFFEDAEVGARILDIQLTSRSKDGVPLCGVPYHAVEPYIAKLIKAGLKVAICEQAQAGDGRRGLLERRIVRVITPGTVGEEQILEPAEKNFLVAVLADGAGFALAAIDVSTGEFLLTRANSRVSAQEEIGRINPREILVERDEVQAGELVKDLRIAVTRLDPSAFAAGEAVVKQRWPEHSAQIGGSLARAAAMAVRYVEENFGSDLAHLGAPRIHRTAEYMTVDEVTRQHLELIVSSDGTRAGSLLSVLNETLTPIGARTLQSWIVYPLLDLDSIGERLDAVEEFFEADLGGEVAEALKRIGDLERLGGRAGSMRAGPRDYLRIAQALDAVGSLKHALAGSRSRLAAALAGRLEPLPELAARIAAAIVEDAPVNPRDGNFIRAGFDPQVDEMRHLASGAREVIARLEQSERERTGITSLKVRYNQLFGYYIEVTKPHVDKVPPDYQRKQTLVGAERFTTTALKELEQKILSAESGLKELELRLLATIGRDLMAHVRTVLATASAVGELDALMSLAKVSRRRGYVRPEINSGLRLWVRDGRHPVLESGMRSGEFVPNDLDVDPSERQLMLITGPNMAGKSTYLRQSALIAIMAQMGSFVPAAEARLGLTDRVLTRIGARDDLRRGESTFMVEMRETARMLEGLSERSLILLDEVGRGTSTFDGLAIAWAVAEHLHDATRAKVLFATHFHELTDLSLEHPRVRNLSMAVREWSGEVLFLRRVIEAPASRSYGIEVARLAGLPAGIIERAREILRNLEQGELDFAGMPRLARARAGDSSPVQMGLFSPAESQVIEELRLTDVDHLTPVEALTKLAHLKDRLRNGDG